MGPGRQKKEDGETMTMRRISVLLVAVVMAMMLSMGSALAHNSGNHKVCHRGNTLYLTHKQANRHINNHPNDYRGKCDNNGGGANIPQLIVKATTSWI